MLDTKRQPNPQLKSSKIDSKKSLKVFLGLGFIVPSIYWILVSILQLLIIFGEFFLSDLALEDNPKIDSPVMPLIFIAYSIINIIIGINIIKYKRWIFPVVLLIFLLYSAYFLVSSFNTAYVEYIPLQLKYFFVIHLVSLYPLYKLKKNS
ncbi:MAG: hypothetical protein CMI53_04055 [Parcubacteria group bacterium]|nr:hypothetical protein [Parcubacteria group bacterium]|tara:strand:+ start:267 stop:716 length:450 start_codon:yes stop_codon:yes gene_type:complete